MLPFCLVPTSVPRSPLLAWFSPLSPCPLVPLLHFLDSDDNDNSSSIRLSLASLFVCLLHRTQVLWTWIRIFWFPHCCCSSNVKCDRCANRTRTKKRVLKNNRRSKRVLGMRVPRTKHVSTFLMSFCSTRPKCSHISPVVAVALTLVAYYLTILAVGYNCGCLIYVENPSKVLQKS